MKMKRLVRNMAMSALAAVSCFLSSLQLLKLKSQLLSPCTKIGTPPDNLDQLLAKVNEAFVRDKCQT